MVVTRRVLLFWTLFIGIGALFGGLVMLISGWSDSDLLGMTALLPDMQKLPFADALFQDLTFPGAALLFFIGLPHLATTALLLARKPVATAYGILCGAVLMLWICIQFVIFPLNFMSTIFFIFGLLEFLTALRLRRLGKR